MQRHGRTVSSESFADRVASTNQARRAQYAHPQDQFRVQAQLLNAFFGPRRGDFEFTEEDVALIQVMVKLSRLASGTHDDSLLDIDGYVECVADLHPSQRNDFVVVSDVVVHDRLCRRRKPVRLHATQTRYVDDVFEFECEAEDGRALAKLIGAEWVRIISEDHPDARREFEVVPRRLDL